MTDFNIKDINVTPDDIDDLTVKLAEMKVMLDGLDDNCVLRESLDHRLDAEYEKVREQLLAANRGLEVAKNLKDGTKRDSHIAKIKDTAKTLERRLRMLGAEQRKHEKGYFPNETPAQNKERTNAVRRRKRNREAAERAEKKAAAKAKRDAEKAARLAARAEKAMKKK